jgi:hypothetical protein
MKKIAVIVEKTSTGFSAYLEKYPVVSTGADVQQLTTNIIEAINFYFEETDEPLQVSKKDLELSFSVPSLFQLYPINVKHFAERIGMNYTLLSQYVQGRKKPSEKQIEKIVDGLKEIGKELSRVSLI